MPPKWFSEYRPQITWMEFNQNVEIDLINRYVYFEVAKVACSTIKARLRKVVIGELPISDKIHPEVSHSPFVKPFQLPASDVADVLGGQGYTRFTFVREPVERAVSGYMDKIARVTEQKKRFVAQFLPDLTPEDDISFELFIDILSEIDDPRKMDKHWRQQSELLLQPVQGLDFVGRFDRFEDDWDKLADLLELPIKEDRESITWHSTSAGTKVNDVVSEESRKKIAKIFENDFNLYEKYA